MTNPYVPATHKEISELEAAYQEIITYLLFRFHDGKVILTLEEIIKLTEELGQNTTLDVSVNTEGTITASLGQNGHNFREGVIYFREDSKE